MDVTVETTYGKVAGRRFPGHDQFRGIPFAAPPTDALRFAPPAPPEAWTGVRETLEYRPSAHQPQSPLPGMTVGPQSEDCLYLNVYTPRSDDTRRPVRSGSMVAASSPAALASPSTRDGRSWSAATSSS
jgi:para-nitrobenzyl esterase